MTMTADEIVDRRRLRRKLSFWRVAAFLILAVALIGFIVYRFGNDGIAPGVSSSHVARVSISGFISDNRRQVELLERLAKDDSVKGVVLAINSSGGTTSGGEALYNAIRKLKAAKPTVATLGTVAASAAYMAAIGAEHIVARRSTITGSIGVIFEYPEVSELMEKLGIKVEEIKSAPLKAEPSPFRPATEEGRAVVRAMIDDTYRWFVAIVREERKLSDQEAAVVGDGRVFTGNQALAAKLVDEIGAEEEARAWLEKEKGVAASLPIRDRRPASDRGFFPLSNAALLWIGQQLGVAPEALRLLGAERFLPIPGKLDGLLSVWQGSLDRHDGEGAPQ